MAQGKTILIIIAVIVVLGIIGVGIYFLYYYESTNPENLNITRCKDTDGGRNYFSAGSTKNPLLRAKDSCTGPYNKFVKEYYCVDKVNISNFIESNLFLVRANNKLFELRFRKINTQSMTVELQEILGPIYPQPASGEKYQIGREFQAQLDSNWTFSIILNNDVQRFRMDYYGSPQAFQIIPLTKPVLGFDYFRCDACNEGRCDTAQTKESVQCKFSNSKPNSAHICYSGFGSCIASSGCSFYYDAPVLGNVEWKSDCEGTPRTYTDAIDETIKFDCSKQAPDFTCIDSDNGIYYAVQGSCLTKNGTFLQDKCAPWNSSDSRSLYECYCERESANYKKYDCPGGCINGACMR